MTVDLERLIRRHQQSGILVDTNILVLAVVGSANRDLIARFKRTQQFLPEDFDTLIALLERFRVHITTPCILAEVSNLIGQLPGDAKERGLRVLAEMIGNFQESYKVSKKLAKAEAFVRLGLTDTSIVESAHKRLVLTDDLDLARFLGNQRLNVINFNHIRERWWN
jgi:hypothetical protein